MSKAWKATERAIAKALNGERVSARSLGLPSPDVVTERLAIECKHRKTLPRWLHDAMAQAVANAPSGKTPIVVLHEARKHHAHDYVVVRLSDLEELCLM